MSRTTCLMLSVDGGDLLRSRRSSAIALADRRMWRFTEPVGPSAADPHADAGVDFRVGRVQVPPRIRNGLAVVPNVAGIDIGAQAEPRFMIAHRGQHEPVFFGPADGDEMGARL